MVRSTGRSVPTSLQVSGRNEVSLLHGLSHALQAPTYRAKLVSVLLKPGWLPSDSGAAAGAARAGGLGGVAWTGLGAASGGAAGLAVAGRQLDTFCRHVVTQVPFLTVSHTFCSTMFGPAMQIPCTTPATSQQRFRRYPEDRQPSTLERNACVACNQWLWRPGDC